MSSIDHSSLHAEKSEQHAQPYTANFTDKTKAMEISRNIYFKIVAMACISLVLIIFLLFSIYWGALWKTPVRNLHGWIVDFDGSTVGQVVTQGLQASEHFGKVSWTVLPASQFPGGPDQVSDDVLNEKIWVAAVINPGASSRLNTSIATIDPSYNSSLAVTVYGVEARSENGFRSLIRPTVQTAFGMIVSQAANRLTQELSSSPNATQIMKNAPQILTQPISYTLNNLRPYDIPVATAITFVGLIYLLLLSFFVVIITMTAREATGLDKSLSTASLIRLRLGTVTVIYFVLSLLYSLLSLAFQVNFSRYYGHAGFLIFWMINYVGMLCLGLALEAMVTLLTMRFMPMFMVLFIISNVSVCFFPIDVMPTVFRYGYAAPFFAVSKAVRTVLFGTKNTLGLDFGILIVWVVISLCTLPLFQWFVRRKEVKESSKREESI